MSGNEKQSTYDQETFERYKAIRNEIAREDNLMSNRLNWFTASQAFLLTALTIGHRGNTPFPTPASDFLFPLVPIAGMCFCLLSFAGILAAWVAIRRWRDLLKPMIAEADYLPSIGKDQVLLYSGWIGPILMPMVFFGAWAY